MLLIIHLAREIPSPHSTPSSLYTLYQHTRAHTAFTRAINNARTLSAFLESKYIPSSPTNLKLKLIALFH